MFDSPLKYEYFFLDMNITSILSSGKHFLGRLKWYHVLNNDVMNEQRLCMQFKQLWEKPDKETWL